MKQVDPQAQRVEEAISFLNRRIRPYLRSKAQRTRHVTADIARWQDFEKAAALLGDLFDELAIWNPFPEYDEDDDDPVAD